MSNNNCIDFVFNFCKQSISIVGVKWKNYSENSSMTQFKLILEEIEAVINLIEYVLHARVFRRFRWRVR